MTVENYTAFRNRVSALIDGEDTGSSTINVATLDVFIELGEGRVYSGDLVAPALRAGSMVRKETLVPVSGLAALPADFLEAVSIKQDGKQLTGQSGWQSGEVRQFGDSLETSENIELRYFARPLPLKDGLHTTFNKYPELFLYAALTEGAQYLGLPQLEVWMKRYVELAKAADRKERWGVLAGVPLRMVAG